MSTELVIKQIERFLASPDPEVLCVRGGWGTGKTHNWKTTAKAAKMKNGGVAMRTYAYVSLFGVNSLAEIKMQIVQATIPTDSIGETIDSGRWTALWDIMEQKVKKGATWAVSALGKNQFEAAMSAMALTISNQIICIDDLERRGAGLNVADVLGLISYFREERGCKVAILLNDGALRGADEKAFQTYLEKVVDVNVLFAPTAEESAAIALKGDDTVTKLVRKYSKRLGVDNIRVIRKIHRLVDMIAEPLAKYEPRVLQSVTKAIVLFGWSHFQPDIAPPLSYIRSMESPWADYIKREPEPPRDPEVERWKAILRRYGHVHSDHFDLVLISGVEAGYFSQADVEGHAELLHHRTRIELANQRMREAFSRFDNCFTNTADEVVADIERCFQENLQHLGLEWLNHVVGLFRRLQCPQAAEATIDLYFSERTRLPGSFDIASMRHRGAELPTDIRERCLQKTEALEPLQTPDEILTTLGNSAQSNELVAKLIDLTIDDYERIFTSHQGEELASILRGASFPHNIEKPSEAEAIMMDRAGAALQRIAAQSEINALRARSWHLIQRLEAKETENTSQ